MLTHKLAKSLFVACISATTWLKSKKSKPVLLIIMFCVMTAPSIGAMANLEQWVNDRLHDILGLSDRYVSQFMIGTARKASSSQDFVTRLEQTGTIDIDQSVIAFAEELFDKVYS